MDQVVATYKIVLDGRVPCARCEIVRNKYQRRRYLADHLSCVTSVAENKF